MSQHRIRVVLTLIALIFSATAANAQRTPPPQDPAKPKIRAITAFVSLDRSKYQQQVADAMKTLKYARTVLESRGYVVQTVRIATQPFSEYTKGLSTEQTVEFFRNYEALAEQQQFLASIGPAMLNANDPETQADVLAEILAGTKSINASLVVASEDGIRWRSVGAAARIIKRLEDTERSQANFRFAAIAMVPPLTPFFPAAYLSGFGHQFAIALESANTVAAVFKDSQDLNTARQKLTETLAKTAFDIEGLAQRIDRDTGWAYVGMDLSPAPMKDISIGAALEDLTQQPFGSSGTLTAAATLTAAIRDVHVKRTGYNGLMIPILEDERLAQRWSEGNISIDGLLSYSAVCGTGLDTVPLPGDVTEQQLDLIIGDMASLAFKWKKPLSARLLPVANKAAGETTDFDDPALVNATIQPLTHR
ncbi:MAG TPA: DUF711 family protein [Candidatus Sulfotelmatobacter sp.]|nr:DUF711 family protein [Candidatus Sulfotelmatobacter sp.]